MNRKITTTIFFTLLSANIFCQNYFPIWTFHQKNINIHGISVGFFSTAISERNTNTNGIRLELIGLGMFTALIPSFPEFDTLPPSERINGLSLSASGTICDCYTNGVSAGFVGQINRQVNGISLSAMMNIAKKQNGVMIATANYTEITNGLQLGLTNGSSKINGVQIAMTINESEEMRGLQIGVVNKSENFRGIQIGIWNVNQKRKLPIVNWNFKQIENEKQIEEMPAAN
jgi:hypothetical protein